MKSSRMPWMWMTAALWACAGCSQDGYQVRLELVGPPGAFTGRTVEVQGITAPAARARSGQAGLWSTEVTLCTRDRDAFLNTPLQVRVLEGNLVRVDTRVERVACRLSPTPAGELEHDVVYLEEGGTLVTDFGGDSRTEAVCYPPNTPSPCPEPHF